jgi:quinolinate synthase
VLVPEPVRSQALGCIERMLDFVKKNPASVAQPQGGFVKNIGAA